MHIRNKNAHWWNRIELSFLVVSQEIAPRRLGPTPPVAATPGLCRIVESPMRSPEGQPGLDRWSCVVERASITEIQWLGVEMNTSLVHALFNRLCEGFAVRQLPCAMPSSSSATAPAGCVAHGLTRTELKELAKFGGAHDAGAMRTGPADSRQVIR